MEIHAVIDRFEGKKAVLLVGDDEIQVVWPKQVLPGEVQEGDILHIHMEIDKEATVAAKAEAESLLKQLLEKNQKDEEKL
jgi:predicted RNA-binding protein (virulence factor B family)